MKRSISTSAGRSDIVPGRKEPVNRHRIKIAALFYGLLTASAVVWGMVRDDSCVKLFFHPDALLTNADTWLSIGVGSLIGIGFGAGVARFSRYTVSRYKWARTMHIEFRGLLGPLDNLDVLAFALFSAVGEELFFRGALQSSFGIVIASLVFGALHIGSGRKFLPWPFLAIIIGFAFGGMFFVTGNLAACITAHFVINYRNLHFINKYNPAHHIHGEDTGLSIHQ
ncbi:MAG: CPBP family intramembrane metalloprotease [Deltaproteobacteria bacterium]|nr:CPBP family intramembrane metalloprotease [Deltaproteobacteria bacterium]